MAWLQLQDRKSYFNQLTIVYYNLYFIGNQVYVSGIKQVTENLLQND